MYRDPNFRNSGGTRLRDGVQASWDRLARSGVFIVACLLLLIAASGLAWVAHIRGRIHQFTTTQALPEQAVTTARPGGQELVHLSRLELTASLMPEFTAATLVPGDGMLVLQAMLSLPGKGDVPVLLATRESGLTGVGANLSGANFSAQVSSREGSHWSAPVELIAGRAAVQQDTTSMPGGTRSEASFSPDVSNASHLVVHTGVATKVSVSLTNRGLELAASARNVSNEARAVTLTWQPALLTTQAGMRFMFVTPPTQASHTANRSTAEQLGVRDFDQVFTSLSHSYLSAGPEIRLRNQADGYTLRLTALTPAIRSLRVQASAKGSAVAVTFSTATDSKGEGSQTTLAPGQSVEWRVRMDALQNTSDVTTAP
ncbi:MAG: hypothetical protein ACRYF4_12455 [Janthinobacterium lividum]